MAHIWKALGIIISLATLALAACASPTPTPTPRPPTPTPSPSTPTLVPTPSPTALPQTTPTATPTSGPITVPTGTPTPLPPPIPTPTPTLTPTPTPPPLPRILIDISSYAFRPDAYSVLQGTQVTWTNRDSVNHTVTSTEAPVIISSGDIAGGQSFSFVFTQPGTYNYICTNHPFMQARIIVQR